MVLIVQTTTLVQASGPAITLLQDDQLLVVSGVTLAATADSAVTGSAPGASVQVAGTVAGFASAIQLGDDGFDTGLRVEVAAGGQVYGGSSSVTAAIDVFGQSVWVQNSGLVSGFYGVALGGGDPMALCQLINTGTISGTAGAVARHAGSVGTLRLVNSGSILAGSFDVAIVDTGEVTVEQVFNTGLIVGQVQLGLGNDIFNGRHGQVIGDVFLGDGNDRFVNIGGILDGTAWGEAGNDLFRPGSGEEVFNGGTGTDTMDFRAAPEAIRVALDGAFDGTGWAAGDLYQAVENLFGGAFGDTLGGNAAANVIRGYDGDDIILAGAASDKVFGGRGSDTLTGGTGNDLFYYETLADMGDAITDFTNLSGNNDSFRFRAADLGGGLAAGVLAASQFVSRTDNLAQDGDDRFIFRTTDATLWFDADGNGAGASILVADLQDGATLTRIDLVLY